MRGIVTLTPNPTVDVSFSVDRVLPTHKMRGDDERHDPGGGGINVARVFVRLGGNARCLYLSGGAAGAALDGLLDLHQLVRTRIPVRNETRVSTSVLERSTGREFRFVTRGPEVAEAEWRGALECLDAAHCDFLVMSGSLPPGAPDDFYARAAAVARRQGIRTVLDSSGPGLAGGLSGPGIYLAKPSIGELRKLSGRALETEAEISDTARRIVEAGKAEHLVVTLGRDGAMLVGADRVLRLPAVPVEAVSAVGAGDSFLAAMVFALAQGLEIETAFRLGIAAGAAALLTPGTGLARPADIHRLAAGTKALA